MSRELRQLWDRAWQGAERRRYVYGRLGLVGSDGARLLTVPHRPAFVYVRMGEQGEQGVNEVRNGGVPLQYDLPVRMVVDRGVLTAVAVDRTQWAGSPTQSGVAKHTHKRGSGLEYEVEAEQLSPGRVRTAGLLTVYLNPFRYRHATTWKTWPGGTLDLAAVRTAAAGEWQWILVGVDPATNTALAAAGAAVTEATALALADLDSIAFAGIPLGGIQVKGTDTALDDWRRYVDAKGWLNLGGGEPVAWTDLVDVPTTFPPEAHTHDYAATVHTHDYAATAHTHDYAATAHTHDYAATAHTHDYAATAHTHDYAATVHTHPYVAVDGTTPLTGDWDLGEDRRLQAEALRARDAEGLRLEDAGGNLGLIVEDGGMVGVGVADPTQPLHVASTMSSGGILLDGTTAPAYVLATAAAARLYLAAATAAGNWFTGTAVGDAAVRAQTGDLWIGTQVAAKALRFLTGAGAQRMHLDGSGNVGVGTTDPDGFEVDAAVTEVLQGRNNARLGIRLGSPRLILEEATSGVQWQVDNNAGVFRYFTPGNVALALTTTGRIGSGAAVGTTPQGKLHLHDGTGGLLFVTATGLNSTTATVLIPNATGDVVRGWAGLLVATDGTNSTATTVTLLNPETLDVTVGTVTLRLELLSSGQLQIKRQTGTGTGAVALFGIWL